VLDNGAVRVGRLEVGPGVLGYGSAGTMVFEGTLDGRVVAVKRMLAAFQVAAVKVRTELCAGSGRRCEVVQ
jgi:serine/threonine-protein kinase/endoribonuclease IRE1